MQADHASLDAWRIKAEPWYLPGGDELDRCLAADRLQLPLLLKGPTGCGKTRLVEHLAWRLHRPLVTVACNEDMGAADLVGRWLLDGDGTRWQDGPLTLAARHGAICYLDEVVEARADALVVIHPLSDTRRMLPIERLNTVVPAHPDFRLVVSYNPGYQLAGKELKTSTRQRFAALALDYPVAAAERTIVMHESGLDAHRAAALVALAERTRRLAGQHLVEGASTRMLIHAAQLMVAGLAAATACDMAIVQPLTDDADTLRALQATVNASF